MPQTQVGTSENLLVGWVRQKTPTTDAAAVNGLMDWAEGCLGYNPSTLAAPCGWRAA